MNAEALLNRLQGVRRNGKGWRALCPAHADMNPSLSIDVRNEKILVHCHAGCSQEAVLAALGIEAHELFLDGSDTKRRIVAEYPYTDEKGELLFQVVRYEPKGFRQRCPDGKGDWHWNLNGVRRVLYRLPELLAEKSLLICEGEKRMSIRRALQTLQRPAIRAARANGTRSTASACAANEWPSSWMRTNQAGSMRSKWLSPFAARWNR